ncbi:isopeptide-forming domain-containing fimbrial protein [Bifidobacterium callitrichos]|nr:SpaA isopeptide-forming pilin-related protein [Bifidobacterium callitrichos]
MMFTNHQSTLRTRDVRNTVVAATPDPGPNGGESGRTPRFSRFRGTRAVASRTVAAVIGAIALIAGISLAPSAALAANPGTLPVASTGTPLSKDSTAELVVRGVETGSTSVAHRVIELKLDENGASPAAPPYAWAEPLREFVRDYDAKHGVDFIADDDSVGDAYAGLQNDETGDPTTATAGQIADFADRLARFIAERSAGSKGTEGSEGNGLAGLESHTGVTGAVSGGDASDAVATFAGLPLGGYLVITSGGPRVHRPVIANLTPQYDAESRQWLVAERFEAVAKHSSPGVDKSINEQRDDGHVSGRDAKDSGSDVIAIGDAVTFDLRADVPVFPNNAMHRDFTIADTMSAGLTLVGESIEVYGVTASAEPAGDDAETRLTAEQYGLSVGADEGSGADERAYTFRIDLGGTYYDGIRGYDAIHVRYRAIVNDRAVVGPTGNPNEVTLEYSNDLYHSQSHDTDKDRVTAFSYGLEVVKTSGDGKPLSGAVFALGGDVADTYEGVVPLTESGRYRLPKRDADGGIVDEDRGALTRDLTVSDSGQLWISGLRPGSYTLTETQAPDGYIIITQPIPFSIVDTATEGGHTDVEFTGTVVGQKTAGYAYREVRNYRGGLPITGAAGVIAFGVIGVLLAGGGVTLAAVMRRRRR